MTTLTHQLQQVHRQIQAACASSQRDPSTVQLIVVSKQRTSAAIRRCVEAGELHIGESYLQEALAKMQALEDCAIVWHFIGPIQSNKTKAIAEHFAWVHSVDRLSIAQRLSQQRPDNLPPLNICLQVNISAEASKHGFKAQQVTAVGQTIAALPRLKLRGLMAIPAATNDDTEQRQAFQQLAQLQIELQQQGLAVDTLSMGMSNDYVAAIAEGATMVRIGSAIFGKREKRQ